MTVQVVRFTTRAEHAADAGAAITETLRAVEEAAPPGTHYLAVRDGDEFTLLLRLDDGVANPLPGIPRAARLREQLAAWAITSPAPRPAQVLGAYRALD